MTNLYSKLCDITHLSENFDELLKKKSLKKQKKSAGSDKISLFQFKLEKTRFLNELHELLIGRNYEPLKLKGIPILKENGSFRLISAPAVRDRIVQKTILGLIYDLVYPYINTGVSYCGVSRNFFPDEEDFINSDDNYNTKKAFDHIADLVRDKNFYVFKSDIKKFYDLIPKKLIIKKVHDIFHQYLNDDSFDKFIEDLIKCKLSNRTSLKKNPDFVSLIPIRGKGIPQGSPLSQFLANIYLADFDYAMKARYGMKYLRYVDDFIVFGQTLDEVKEAKQYAIKYIKQLGLELSEDPRKTKHGDLKKESIVFLGLRLSKESVWCKNSDPELYKWVKDVLDYHSYLYKNLEPKEVIVRMNQRIQGKGNYLIYYHSHRTFSTINKYIEILRKNNKKYYSKIQLLDSSRIQPFRESTEWQSYFET